MSFVDKRFNVVTNCGEGIRLVQLGWQKCNSGHPVSPRAYPHYSITFVKKGHGTFETAGQSYYLGPGDGFIILPDTVISYIADEKDPWEYYFAVFYGNDCSTLLKSLQVGYDNPCFSFSNNAELYESFERMLVAANESIFDSGYMVTGCFYNCIGLIISNMSKPSTDTRDTYINKAKAFIKSHYPYNISISDVADAAGIERSYLYRIFKEKLGISPQEWLTTCRLENAISMMNNTEMSITEIGNSAGFYDTAHFSKVFKTKYGCSPREFSRKKQELH